VLLVHNEIHYMPIGDGWEEVLVSNVLHYVPILHYVPFMLYRLRGRKPMICKVDRGKSGGGGGMEWWYGAKHEAPAPACCA
jgi:hypothetical protein